VANVAQIFGEFRLERNGCVIGGNGDAHGQNSVTKNAQSLRESCEGWATTPVVARTAMPTKGRFSARVPWWG